jgi:hypothetical protein
MTVRRDVPPSRLRYEAAHPTVAVHCDVETKARLLALREATGLSLGALVKQGLGVLEPDLESARRAGYAAGKAIGRAVGQREGRTAGIAEGRKSGHAEAVNLYRITYPCPKCRKLVPVVAGSDQAADARTALIEAGWEHTECPDVPEK